MLFAEGFAHASMLSRKMVLLYRMASEQLSQQDHYDFGMRALKAVLLLAGTSHRNTAPVLGLGDAEPAANNADAAGAGGEGEGVFREADYDQIHGEEDSSYEDEVACLLAAMRGANLPKLLPDDARLFEGLIQDLFPSAQTKPPPQEHRALQAAIEAAYVKLGLQPAPACVTKALQLKQTLEVRFGTMLVGPPGSGKSRTYKALQKAMVALHYRAVEFATMHGTAVPEMYPRVHSHVLNPKAVTIGELYGE